MSLGDASHSGYQALLPTDSGWGSAGKSEWVLEPGALGSARSGAGQPGGASTAPPPPPVKKREPEALASPENTVPPQGPLQGQLRTLGSEHSWTIGAHRAQRVLSGSDRFWELPL